MTDPDLKAAQARAVVQGGNIRVADESAVVGRPRPQGAIKPESKVELIREGGQIRGVEVICGCGERIRLRFDFE
ncbi:hypothetical protein [Zavarzinella formosa]|uniref:hypothetical protein n=1 Tax=Zavarzinella formosa TaxID=360055 RepID=UPI0003058831|nr:hypothetical protein [Zavarzinella formosa]